MNRSYLNTFCPSFDAKFIIRSISYFVKFRPASLFNSYNSRFESLPLWSLSIKSNTISKCYFYDIFYNYTTEIRAEFLLELLLTYRIVFTEFVYFSTKDMRLGYIFILVNVISQFHQIDIVGIFWVFEHLGNLVDYLSSVARWSLAFHLVLIYYSSHSIVK